MFRKQNQDESKEHRIKTFITTATDTESVKRIFEDIKKVF